MAIRINKQKVLNLPHNRDDAGHAAFHHKIFHDRNAHVGEKLFVAFLFYRVFRCLASKIPLKNDKNTSKNHLKNDKNAPENPLKNDKNSVIHLDLRANAAVHKAFEGDFDVDQMILAITSLVPGTRFVPKKTLLILDEIQDCAKRLARA